MESMSQSMESTNWSEIGQSIPAHTPHAVSVSLPTWESIVGYEKGEEWVLSKMKTGYPRFYVHKHISSFADKLKRRYGADDDQVMLFPSRRIAERCVEFLGSQDPFRERLRIRILDLVSVQDDSKSMSEKRITTAIGAVFYPPSCSTAAKAFWQHTGEGASSRRVEFAHKAFDAGLLIVQESESSGKRRRSVCKGPRRYQQHQSSDDKDENLTREPGNDGNSHSKQHNESKEHSQFIEERYGRNLDFTFSQRAKTAIRRRIAGSLTDNVNVKESQNVPNKKDTARARLDTDEKDVFLYPSGMSAIFNAHRILLATYGPLQSICFGFPYIDTLKILEKWGPGCRFYGNGDANDLDDIERRLKRGERFLGLFCEFPGNPLLKTPDLCRISSLSNQYGFAVVVDETIGNFLNVNVLPHSDMVVSSLTKIFSGDSNVMGGSLILNPGSQRHDRITRVMAREYEDNYWTEDALFMERNSRDFVQRIAKINTTAEAVCDRLKKHPKIKEVYYPKYSSSRNNYEQCRNIGGGFGGLFSVTFFSTSDAVTFFDQLETAKGPSLGTNFTLSSPYTLLAHYSELEWASSYGVEADLVRISIGLEETNDLVLRFERALSTIDDGRRRV